MSERFGPESAHSQEEGSGGLFHSGKAQAGHSASSAGQAHVSGSLAFSPVPCNTLGSLAPPYRSSAGLSVEKTSVSGCLHCPAGNQSPSDPPSPFQHFLDCTGEKGAWGPSGHRKQRYGMGNSLRAACPNLRPTPQTPGPSLYLSWCPASPKEG